MTDVLQRREPTGSLAQAIARTRTLLGRDPRLAEAQAREIVRVVPGAAEAHALMGAALAAQERRDEAIAALRRATMLDPASASAWRLLAGQLIVAGDAAGAGEAHARELAAATRDPVLQAAARALCDGDLPRAEHLLRGHLKQRPDDSVALRMLAEVGGRLGHAEDALAMLDHALALSPGFTAARFNRALALYRLNRAEDALAELDGLIARDPADPSYANLKGAILSGIGDLGAAITLFEQALTARPAQPRVWVNYGHGLKTIGRQADGIAAYRRALALDPRLGEAWWSLANLKTVRLGKEDVAAMEAALARPDATDDDRFHLQFALGKACEDAGDDAPAFAHYAEGNRLRRAQLDYHPSEVEDRVARARAVLTPAFFDARRGWGHAAADPIFVLGMPRAGSTLVEQILASHSRIEGTQELPDIQRLARREAAADGGDYPATLAAFGPARLAALGAEYMDRTRVQRRTDRPLFVDKMPNNWAHVPFIHLVLPNARIIDARRHPLACGFSNFKQHFAQGQAWSYDLSEIGRYYAAYVDLMVHVDAVLPGRVHRIHHEALVDEPEREIRRLLDHLGLDFEPGCLRFHETERPVRTASSEQVRRPISRAGVDQWRRFDAWLGPLRDTLSEIVTDYSFAS